MLLTHVNTILCQTLTSEKDVPFYCKHLIQEEEVLKDDLWSEPKKKSAGTILVTNVSMVCLKSATRAITTKARIQIIIFSSFFLSFKLNKLSI